MGQIQLTTSLVLIGLFSIAVIAFAIGFANDNNTTISIADDTEISGLNSLTTGNLSGFDDNSESQYQSIIETTIAPGSGTAPSVGPFAITPLNAIGVVKNILQVGYTKIFGTGSGFGIFLTTFMAMIIFMVGLYVYKTLRGLPD